jgi:hypothetical protein
MFVGTRTYGDVRTPPDLGANLEQQDHGTKEPGSRGPTGVDVRTCGNGPSG